MKKWVLSFVPITALVATTAIAAPVWYTNGYETSVRGRVTDVEYPGTGSTAVVVIEDRDRVVVAPNAQVAMADVRPGEEVEARYVQSSNGEKSMLSIVPVFREI
ncbi:MAG: TOBE domain-containing protein [Candidatus Rokuibacteriota bacterium]